ncbi:MAG: PadR family transcriptional regulator [Acidobacteria bacterium]|nr:PadR family transcriptional regulator [Acidobacteriota bacterium]
MENTLHGAVTLASKSLGEFEQMVLLAVLRRGDDAYGAAVRDELTENTSRQIARGAMYVTLDRLERKGLLRSRMGEPTPERGGRAKRYYELSDDGRVLLRQAGRDLMNLWQGQESLIDDA